MNKRIQSLDFIRGFAMLGILLINIPGFQTLEEDFSMPTYSGIEKGIDILIKIFIEKKFFGLFSILFGIGIGIFMDNSLKKTLSPYKMMIRRLTFLFAFGLIHTIFIFWGSVLAPYAIIGVITFGLYGFKAQVIKVIFITLTAIYTLGMLLKISGIEFSILNLMLNDIVLIIIFFILGLYLTKSNYIYNEATPKNSSNRNHIIFILLGIILIFSSFLYALGLNSKVEEESIALLAIPQTILYFIILEKISLSNNLTYVKLFFSTIGKMAFSNYVLQSIIGVLIMKTLGIIYPSPFAVLYLTILVIITNFIISFIILKRFNQGPLEWLWRNFTYNKVDKGSKDINV